MTMFRTASPLPTMLPLLLLLLELQACTCAFSLSTASFAPAPRRQASKRPLTQRHPLQHPSGRWSAKQRTSLDMSAVTDTAFVLAAGAIAAAAGLLTYSVASGEKGLNSFLMRERDSNPFYSKNFKAEKPEPPSWFNIKLPDFPYVEVYGQTRASSSSSGATQDRSALYAQLDAAIESEDYDRAAQIKKLLDGGDDEK